MGKVFGIIKDVAMTTGTRIPASTLYGSIHTLAMQPNLITVKGDSPHIKVLVFHSFLDRLSTQPHSLHAI
jgi:hypothetical protein